MQWGLQKHDGTAIDPASTLFRWSSGGESLVGVVAAFLEESGQIELDKDITEYWDDHETPSCYLTDWHGTPAGVRDECLVFELNLCCQFTHELPPDKRHISLRQLLGHRAGIQHYTNGRQFLACPPCFMTRNPDINTGMEWATRLIRNQPLVTIPGTNYCYSSFGFNLAACGD